MKKQATYIFLPADGEKQIGQIEYFSTYNTYQVYSGGHSIGKPYHLYVLSEGVPKSGDWYWIIGSERIMQSCGEQEEGDYKNCKRIIATTNPELHNKKNPNHNEDSYVIDVPSISLLDVVYIISLHNDKIKPNSNSIMVEYENVNSGWKQLANNGKRGSTIVLDNLVPKLDKEGNITIIRDIPIYE